MNVLVYGGGAVGLGISSCLIKSGTRVTILARSDTKLALENHGLVREGIFGAQVASPRDFLSVDALSACAGEKYDYILVCTKSFDTERVASDLKEHAALFGPACKVVLFQNGWGNAEIMAAHLPNDTVYSARVITGFIRPEKNRVAITVHADAIHIGSLFSCSACEELLPLCNAISDGGIACINVRNIGKDIWAKMLYNCALNPLGAIFSVPYGVLALNNETREIMDIVIEEIYSVMEKCGYETFWRSASEYRKVFYGDMVRLTRAHESSMLQDIRAGKKTEIDALNGAVTRLALDAGIDAPINLCLSRMIRFLSGIP